MSRIVIIDDDEGVRDLLREALETTGREVVTAVNGREGLHAHRAEAADLVICDILMPELDGIQVMQELRRCSPSLKLIAISGCAERLRLDVLKIATLLGAAAVFEKPFLLDDLIAKVNELLPAPAGAESVPAGPS